MDNRDREQRTVELADSYIAGLISRRTFIYRLLALGLTTSAAGAILAACTPAAGSPSAGASAAGGGSATPFTSAAPNAELKGDVRVLGFPESANEDALQATIQAAFKVLYPNVTIKYTIGDWTLAEQLRQSSAQEGAHDVYLHTDINVPKINERDDLWEDITDYANDPSRGYQIDHQLYWDRALSLGPRLIALPMAYLPLNALFINLDLAEKAGLGPDFADTEATLAEGLIKMTKAPDVYGSYLANNIGQAGSWVSKGLLSEGHNFLTQDLKAVDINQPDVVRATEWFVDLYKKACPPVGAYEYNTLADAFVGQKIAALSMDLSVSSAIELKQPSFPWKIVPFPPSTTSGKTQKVLGGMDMYGLGAKSQNKDAAFAWISFFLSGEQSAYYLDGSTRTPVRDDSLEFGYGTQAPAPFAEAAPTFATIADFFQLFPQAFEAWTACNNQIDRANDGQITAKEAVEAAHNDVQKIIFG